MGDDPLGVRGDFPVVEENIYLNSAYITPSPRQAVEAAPETVSTRHMGIEIGNHANRRSRGLLSP